MNTTSDPGSIPGISTGQARRPLSLRAFSLSAAARFEAVASFQYPVELDISSVTDAGMQASCGIDSDWGMGKRVEAAARRPRGELPDGLLLSVQLRKFHMLEIV